MSDFLEQYFEDAVNFCLLTGTNTFRIYRTKSNSLVMVQERDFPEFETPDNELLGEWKNGKKLFSVLDK